jgi:hypothetical protein
MLPFVREMLRMGCEVVLVANSLPAINDITATELRRCARNVCVRVQHVCVRVCGKNAQKALRPCIVSPRIVWPRIVFALCVSLRVVCV